MIKRYFPLYDDEFDEIHYLEVDKGSVFKVKDFQVDVVPVLQDALKYVKNPFVLESEWKTLINQLENILEDLKC